MMMSTVGTGFLKTDSSAPHSGHFTNHTSHIFMMETSTQKTDHTCSETQCPDLLPGGDGAERVSSLVPRLGKNNRFNPGLDELPARFCPVVNKTLQAVLLYMAGFVVMGTHGDNPDVTAGCGTHN
jgi:hypothetical protein